MGKKQVISIALLIIICIAVNTVYACGGGGGGGGSGGGGGGGGYTPPYPTAARGGSGGCEGDECGNATGFDGCNKPPNPDDGGGGDNPGGGGPGPRGGRTGPGGKGKKGEPPVVGDPVYISTGEFVYDVTDFSIRGKALTVEITRNYGSQLEGVWPFGRGWDFNYDKR